MRIHVRNVSLPRERGGFRLEFDLRLVERYFQRNRFLRRERLNLEMSMTVPSKNIVDTGIPT
jgi:hypothetical protein